MAVDARRSCGGNDAQWDLRGHLAESGVQFCP